MSDKTAAFLFQLAQIAIHTTAVYIFLIVVIRVLGRRTFSQLSPTDLTIVLLLGSAVETAMVTASTLLRSGIVSTITLLLLTAILNKLMLKSKKFRHLVNGGPKLLVHDGAYIHENMMRAGLTEGDVNEALRGREIACLDDVKFAVLEPDGSINVVPTSSKVHTSKTSLAGDVS
jgi:uncharacterized membrane protein YcaP (DUF421 family)